MVAFYQRQAQELATITALVTRRKLLGSVRQTQTVWVRNRSHTFFDRIVAGWDEAEWKRNFRIGRPTFHFLCTAFPNCRDLRDREPRCEANPGAAFGYCPCSKRSAQEGFRRQSAFIRDWPFFLTPRTRLDTSSTHLRRRVELGLNPVRGAHVKGVKWVEPGFNPLLWCPCERGVHK